MDKDAEGRADDSTEQRQGQARVREPDIARQAAAQGRKHHVDPAGAEARVRASEGRSDVDASDGVMRVQLQGKTGKNGTEIHRGLADGWRSLERVTICGVPLHKKTLQEKDGL